MSFNSVDPALYAALLDYDSSMRQMREDYDSSMRKWMELVAERMEYLNKLEKEVAFLRKHVDSTYLEQWSNLQELEQYTQHLKQKEQNYYYYQSNDDGLNILQLPDEILVKIFSYLSRHDILRGVAIVCKKFKNITHDQFQEIFLRGYIYPFNFIDSFLETLECSKNLTKLNISCHSKFTEERT